VSGAAKALNEIRVDYSTAVALIGRAGPAAAEVSKQ
jgi:hypothetical protein